MNIVVVTDIGVDVYKKWTDVKKYSGFNKEDFTPVGKDFVVNVNAETYEVSKDIRLLERVASEKVFTKNKMEMSDWMMVGTFIMSLLIYMK